eukprot:m.62685 g.62685  ORF g.62685 m.62685 type:complete len:238 (-) comp23187_c0_seq1:539-1252(-)
MTKFMMSRTTMGIISAFVITTVVRASPESESVPEAYVKCDTTQGPLTIEVYPDWSPLGAERFLQLVDDNFFENMLFYRAIDSFLIQFGVAATPEVHARWDGKRMPDETNPGILWRKGVLSYAGGGTNSRSCHMFITLTQPGVDVNHGLGSAHHETPFARVMDDGIGFNVLDAINKEYGDRTLNHQHELGQKGNQVMADLFPNLDKIHSCFRIQQPQQLPSDDNHEMEHHIEIIEDEF